MIKRNVSAATNIQAKIQNINSLIAKINSLNFPGEIELNGAEIFTNDAAPLHTNVHEKKLHKLFRALSFNFNITKVHIDLKQANLIVSNELLKLLFEAINNNTNITTLEISNLNFFDFNEDEGGRFNFDTLKCLLDKFSKVESLKFTDCTFCKLYPQWQINLWKAVLRNKSLKQLSISGSEFVFNKAYVNDVFLSNIEKSNTLVQLDLLNVGAKIPIIQEFLPRIISHSNSIKYFSLLSYPFTWGRKNLVNLYCSVLNNPNIFEFNFNNHYSSEIEDEDVHAMKSRLKDKMKFNKALIESFEFKNVNRHLFRHKNIWNEYLDKKHVLFLPEILENHKYLPYFRIDDFKLSPFDYINNLRKVSPYILQRIPSLLYNSFMPHLNKEIIDVAKGMGLPHPIISYIFRYIGIGYPSCTKKGSELASALFPVFLRIIYENVEPSLMVIDNITNYGYCMKSSNGSIKYKAFSDNSFTSELIFRKHFGGNQAQIPSDKFEDGYKAPANINSEFNLYETPNHLRDNMHMSFPQKSESNTSLSNNYLNDSDFRSTKFFDKSDDFQLFDDNDLGFINQFAMKPGDRKRKRKSVLDNTPSSKKYRKISNFSSSSSLLGNSLKSSDKAYCFTFYNGKLLEEFVSKVEFYQDEKDNIIKWRMK